MALCYFLFKTHILLVILFTCSLFSQFSFLPPIPFLLFNPFSPLQSLFSSSIPFFLLQSLFSSSNPFSPPPIPFLLLNPFRFCLLFFTFSFRLSFPSSHQCFSPFSPFGALFSTFPNHFPFYLKFHSTFLTPYSLYYLLLHSSLNFLLLPYPFSHSYA